jgi:antitoxin component YwqK of YwqJK toxin-antitoxin module
MKKENLTKTTKACVCFLIETDNGNSKNMKLIMIATVALIITMMFGCAPAIEEAIVETYADGTPKVVKYYTGEGREKTMVKEAFFYPDGKLRMEGEYKEGLKDGRWASFYNNGNNWSEGFYKLGINHGKTTTWHENGQKYYEGFYNEGKRSGIWKFWDESGGFIKEIDYGSINDK